jgi:histidinol dehydrogenase
MPMNDSPCRALALSSPDGAPALLAWLAGRAAADGADAAATEAAVRAILGDVKTNGVEALIRHTRRFDCPGFSEAMLSVPPETLARAAGSIPRADLAVIREAAGRIRRFHEAQKEQSWFVNEESGALFGQTVTAVDRAGLYVPGGAGGETPLVSSLLMNAVPALVAGVGELQVVSPPRKDGSLNPYLLAAAHELGIRWVFACGSAWAVAALAYGAGPIGPVDVIAGPGNIWVTTAKRLLLGRVGIDMLAGPSEICIIADQSADPAWLAADMLSQAEHDTLASSICIVTSEALAGQVQKELTKQAAALPRSGIALRSLKDWGAVILAPDLESAAALANCMAPEHLELCVAEPWALLPRIRHAGAVFMGHHAAEPAGDYFAGPNHVLPTMGTARFASALSVQTFCKKTSILAISPEFSRAHAASIARLARLEGLEAHARSMEMRMRG